MAESFKQGTQDGKTERDPWLWTEAVDLEHTEWCRKNDINPTSVRSI
eukprot:CAMPEP_0118722242 /NCGR_PEP_ID=MMETSP0800-20121206/31239_1 /TAXON_ID=210618 ORGANISM="Striatella unipunctata, Strain CCMP2910" /NCGR_SAMPLE_ID=MMETSP0800 /ASSEMBLY_ACC=CAM_ASM_000638 /LENGTH=46 /DNA_ID= /DNA_START= /DNA_END= /DNA_ORIENTATION=